jgi:zinc protease
MTQMLTQFSLKNKLKVLLVESHKAPVVAVQMWVKTGSADEKRGEEGISHFIEHLVFKGTRKYGVGEVAKTVEGAGGELNAYTTFDQTVFHVTMSREHLNVGLDCIAEMLGFPKFDPVEIDRERGVVLEEIKRSFDSPQNTSNRQLFSTMYKKHPYGIPVIGYSKNIEKVKPKTLTNYFESRYVPSNMCLVIAGDFDKSKIKSQITALYGQYKAHPLKKIKRLKDAKQTKPLSNYLLTEFKECALNISFRAPAADHPDVPALDVLGFILGQGDSSRLVKRLRLDEPLVLGISAGGYNPLDSGLFAISAYFRPENYQKVITIINEEVERLLSSLPSQEELDRSRLNLQAEEVFSLETVDGLANKVGIFQLLLKDPQYVQKYLKKVERLTPQDLLKVARKYLKPSGLSMTLMLEKSDGEKIPKKNFETALKVFSKLLIDSSKNKVSADVKKKSNGSKSEKFSSKKGASTNTFTASVKKQSPILKHRLSNGALVLMKRNAEVPIMHIKAGFLGGIRVESLKELGVSAVLSNTWTSGSAKFNENEIANRIEGCAGSLSAFGGRNSVGLTVESLSTYKKNALELFSDVLAKPTFPEEAVKREAGIQLEHLKNRSDHPSSVAGQLFMEKMFEGHPYALDQMGSEQSLSDMNSTAVRSQWKNMVTSDNAVFVAVGDFHPDQQLKIFETLSSELGRGTKYDKIFPLSELKKDEWVFSKSVKEQSHIIVGYRGISYTDKSRYSLQLLQAILAGQGGRLFLELRDKASLAYTVSPVHMEGIETGYFGVYIGCSPEKGKTAIEMIHAELEKISSHKPSEEELERAKKYLVGRNHIDLQRNGSQAASILFDELYGVDSQETFKFADHLKMITGEEIRTLAHQIFSKHSVTVAVGPNQPW